MQDDHITIEISFLQKSVFEADDVVCNNTYKVCLVSQIRKLCRLHTAALLINKLLHTKTVIDAVNTSKKAWILYDYTISQARPNCGPPGPKCPAKYMNKRRLSMTFTICYYPFSPYIHIETTKTNYVYDYHTNCALEVRLKLIDLKKYRSPSTGHIYGPRKKFLSSINIQQMLFCLI